MRRRRKNNQGQRKSQRGGQPPMVKAKSLRVDAYGNRNAVLRMLEFPSYQDYLASPLWAEIRSAVLHRTHSVCQICNGTATQVHHRNYHLATLRGADTSGLVALCRGCHEKIEFHNGHKLHAAVTDAWLTFLLTRKQNPPRKARATIKKSANTKPITTNAFRPTKRPQRSLYGSAKERWRAERTAELKAARKNAASDLPAAQSQQQG